jgi:hypothetical protein
MTYANVWPTQPGTWPPAGTLSPQRTVLVGEGHVLLPAAATYPANPQIVAGRIARSQEAAVLAGAQAVTLCLPARARCLADLNPLEAAGSAPEIWGRLSELLAPDPGVLFLEQLAIMASPERRHEDMPFRLTDGGTSLNGAAIVVDALLERLGVHVQVQELVVTRSKPLDHLGAFGSAWPIALWERTTLGPRTGQGALRAPRLTQVERGIRCWKNEHAPHQVKLAVLDRGAATGPESPTWWLPRLFGWVMQASREALLIPHSPDVLVRLLPEEELGLFAGDQ